MESPWAQLVSVTEVESSAIPLIKDKFVIGRNSDCDLALADNKLVSGKHCYINRDEHGRVWLYDTSTNGTLLNLSIKLTKGECRELHHGDEIHVVHKKNDTKDDIGYMFQDIEALRAEASSESEDTQECTQVMEFDGTLSDENVNTVTTPNPLKRKKSVEISPVLNKKVATDPPTIALVDDVKEERKVSEVPLEHADKTSKSSSTAEVKQQQRESSVTAETKQEHSEASQKSQEKSIKQTTAEKSVAPQEPEEDAIAETLVCIICQELLHDCISLQPCMHSFCAGCYSEWMERSQECPSCRLKVTRISKNHIVNNLVEAYLKVKPDKKRPEADIKELESKNKITRDMLYPVHKSGGDSNSGSSSDIYTDDDDEDDSYSSGATAAPLVTYKYTSGSLLYGITKPAFDTATMRPAQTVCRQCPGFAGRQNTVGAGLVPQLGGTNCNRAVPDPSATAGSSTAGSSTAGSSTAGSSTDGTVDDPDAKRFPVAPVFTCPINGNHVLCLCCMQPMPDRRNPYIHGGPLPPQQCSLCFRAFCHAYWGCQKVDCQGCLAEFQDLNFGKKCLTSLVLDNHYESRVLTDYITGVGMSVRDLFKECLQRVNKSGYTFTDQARLTSLQGYNTPVCYGCGFKAFKELAYYYRMDIPADSLPKAVTSRPNCYWGKNCRTQKNKPEHAVRYNHICEQSRSA